MKTNIIKTLSSLESNNHSALSFNESVAEKVDLICSPLFRYFGITHFGYIRFFNDGTMLRIANNKDWTRNYFEKSYYNDSALYNMNNISEEKAHLLLLTGNPQGDHLMSLCNDYDIWNALAIYEKFHNYNNFWFFGTSPQNTEAINFYINKLDLLKKFTLYFRDKFSEDLTSIDQGKIIRADLSLTESIAKQEEKEKIKIFFEALPLKSYDLGENLFITKKELEILYYLVQGKTSKEIARFTNNSFRTIESHIEKLKLKVGCQKKSQLINLLLKNRSFSSLLHKF